MTMQVIEMVKMASEKIYPEIFFSKGHYYSNSYLVLMNSQNYRIKKIKSKGSFNSLSNDVWFYDHPSHRNGQNGRPKKLTPKKVSRHIMKIGLLQASDNFFFGQFFSDARFDHFYGSDDPETIHHSKED